MKPPVLLIRGVVVAACCLIFVAGADVGASRVGDMQSAKYLDELNQTLLRRSESAIDYSASVLDEVVAGGLSDCREASLQAVRLRVYQNSLIKDIRTLDADGTIRCSAYSETLEFDKTWATRDEMLPIRAGSSWLFRVERFTSDALGIVRHAPGTAPVAAIVGIDPSQFDILPNELRPTGRVALRLDNGQTIASFDPPRAPPAEPVVAQRHSDRYPIVTEVIVDSDALRGWNSLSSPGLLAGAGLLGLLVGLLVARPVGRPPQPLEELDLAIARREFVPFFQPIFDLQTRRVIGCEALMRWAKPDGRIVGPGTFIALAEGSGRIETMTWHLLEAALTALQTTLQADPHFKLSINVVPRHLLASGFSDILRRTVTAHGGRPDQICLEITERDALEDLDRAAGVIAALQNEGFRVAIDDVGVGHSGLSYIQRLRADTLKIDKFFVDSLALNGSANAVVGTLVRLARELNMTVVAEGVETEAQVAALRACDVEEAQGYIMAPPLAAPAFLDLLQAKPAAQPADRPLARVA